MSSSGKVISAEDMSRPSYWSDRIAQASHFYKGFLASIHQLKCNFFIEIGPLDSMLQTGKRIVDWEASRGSILNSNFVWKPSLSKIDSIATPPSIHRRSRTVESLLTSADVLLSSISNLLENESAEAEVSADVASPPHTGERRSFSSLEELIATSPSDLLRHSSRQFDGIREDK